MVCYWCFFVVFEHSELMLYGKAKVSNLYFLFLLWFFLLLFYLYLEKPHACSNNYLFLSYVFPFLPKFNLDLVNENNDLLEEKVQNKSINVNISYIN